MKSFEYSDYSHYLEAQVAGYKSKSSMLWAKQNVINAICANLDKPSSGKMLCHGVRTGREVQMFANTLRPAWTVLGTDIGNAIHGLVVKWDFNKTRLAWLNAFDLVYSNAIDHAWALRDTLHVWCCQLRVGGTLILEWSKYHEHEKPTEIDPLCASLDEVIKEVSRFVDAVKLIELPDERQAILAKC